MQTELTTPTDPSQDDAVYLKMLIAKQCGCSFEEAAAKAETLTAEDKAAAIEAGRAGQIAAARAALGL